MKKNIDSKQVLVATPRRLLAAVLVQVRGGVTRDRAIEPGKLEFPA